MNHAREEAIAHAAWVLASGRDRMTERSPREAAEEAHYAGGPSVEVIEAQIIADRRPAS